MTQSDNESEQYRAGRKQALDALLAANRPLTVRELYTQLGVSRRPLERSLERLIREGLIESPGTRRRRRGTPGSPVAVYAPTKKGRELGANYVPPTGSGTWAKLPGWGVFSVRRLEVVRVLLGADATGLTTTGIARLTQNSPDNVRTTLLFGMDRGLVRRTVIAEVTPITHAYSLTPDGITASEAYIRAHSRTEPPHIVRVSLDPAIADLPAALALLEQLRGMPGVVVS